MTEYGTSTVPSMTDECVVIEAVIVEEANAELPDSVKEDYPLLPTPHDYAWKNQPVIDSPRSSFRLVMLALIVTLALASVALLYSRNEESSDESVVALGGVTLYREGYEPLVHFTSESEDSVAYSHLKDYLGVLEPHATMHLYANSYDVEDKSTDSYFVFQVCSSGSAEDVDIGTCETGYLAATSVDSVETSGVTVGCTPGDVYSLSVSEVSSDGSVLSSYSGDVLCSYVRREIRSLTTDDLNAVLDSMYEMWVTEEESGQETYGSDYHYFSYFSQCHHFHSAWVDSDHFHEGLGFLPQHIKMTNMFELSMQAVDPTVSLPYWDYTIESASGESIFDSFMFTADTFGTMTPPNDKVYGWTYRKNSFEDAIIPDGRWAQIKVPTSASGSDLYSNFGFLRSPWNSNPSKYVSRFPAYTLSLPSCANYYDWLNTDSLSTFLSVAPFAPHSLTHGTIGNVFGCDSLDVFVDVGILENDISTILVLCETWGFIIKELYRKNMIVASTSCSALYEARESDGLEITTDYSCVAQCDDDRSSLIGALRAVMEKLLKDDFSDTTETQWAYIVDTFLCNNGTGFQVFEGDHLESGSPSDPSFWPIHPSQDRAFQARLQSGGFADSFWPTDSVNDFVCSKSQCYELIDGEYSFDYFTECCDGHYPTDALMDFVNENRSAWIGDTNEQTITNIDVDTYNMPYIYDHFKWDHCSQDFQGMFQEYSLSSSRRR